MKCDIVNKNYIDEVFMKKEEEIKIEDILNKIDKDFPKVSLKNVSLLEEFIRNESLDEKTVKDLSFFLIEYDKKSVDNNTKYGFPESDFEDYKKRDLFLSNVYKELILRFEKDTRDTEKIREFIRLGGQKAHDRKVPFRCLKLGRLDFEDSADGFKELISFYQEKVKRYDKGYKFQESANTKAYIDNKKNLRANIIKLAIVIVIVIIISLIGQQVGIWAQRFFDKPKIENETEEVRNITVI